MTGGLFINFLPICPHWLLENPFFEPPCVVSAQPSSVPFSGPTRLGRNAFPTPW